MNQVLDLPFCVYMAVYRNVSDEESSLGISLEGMYSSSFKLGMTFT